MGKHAALTEEIGVQQTYQGAASVLNGGAYNSVWGIIVEEYKREEPSKWGKRRLLRGYG